MSTVPSSGSLDAAVCLVAAEPGWPGRILQAHVRRDSGDCDGCGWYRPTSWPCVLVHIAHRAEQLQRDHCRSGRPDSPAGGRCPLTPAASRTPPRPDITGAGVLSLGGSDPTSAA